MHLHVKGNAWFNVLVCKSLSHTRLDPENKAGKAEGCFEEWAHGGRFGIEPAKPGKLRNKLTLTTNQFLTDLLIVLTSERLITGASVSQAASYLNGTAGHMLMGSR